MVNIHKQGPKCHDKDQLNCSVPLWESHKRSRDEPQQNWSIFQA